MAFIKIKPDSQYHKGNQGQTSTETVNPIYQIESIDNEDDHKKTDQNTLEIGELMEAEKPMYGCKSYVGKKDNKDSCKKLSSQLFP